MAEVDILSTTQLFEWRRGVRRQIEIAISSLKTDFGLDETLATILVVLVTRMAAKICTHNYALLVNRISAGPQSCIKECWA